MFPYTTTLQKTKPEVRHKTVIAARDVEYPSILSGASESSIAVNSKRFREFFDLMDVLYTHAMVRASISLIGRSISSAGWSLVEDPSFVTEAQKEDYDKLYEFYTGYNQKAWNNIKDFYGTGYKFSMAAMYLRYFGQAAFYIVRDPVTEEPISYDFLHGLVVPNVDANGFFKTPAFIQYLDRAGQNKVEFSSPEEIVYIANPDFSGSPLGGTDVSALSDFSLPIDIYLQVSAREYLKNRNKPEVIWELPQDISDEAFDTFCDMLEDSYQGPYNIGKNPIAIAGEVKIHELRSMPDGLPYQESRKTTRDELLAATGLTGHKLGIGDNLTEASVKEYRREFTESTIQPTTNMIAEAFYTQVHIREFGIKQWRLQFNKPNFLTAVEQATVHMRYIQNGVYSVNDARHDIGKPPIEDGDKYIDITAGEGGRGNEQGSPPEGREQRPDAPQNTGEPDEESGGNDPERGDRSVKLIEEFDRWQTFAINRIKRGKQYRDFSSALIDEESLDYINNFIRENYTIESVKGLFSFFRNYVSEEKE